MGTNAAGDAGLSVNAIQWNPDVKDEVFLNYLTGYSFDRATRASNQIIVPIKRIAPPTSDFVHIDRINVISGIYSGVSAQSTASSHVPPNTSDYSANISDGLQVTQYNRDGKVRAELPPIPAPTAFTTVQIR
ncbi:Hypothetical protein POVN_LOCUS104 [uncultured virus]|nr:Hypothetical protein POVN_LOCUS104 [uncultured virus]